MTDYIENFTQWAVALITGLFTAIVSFLGGADAGQTVYDVLTVTTASLAVFSGAMIVSSEIGQTRLKWAQIRAGDVWTIGACLVILTTGVSAYHTILMVYWSIQDGPAAVGPEANAAFENWHILLSLSLWGLHLWMKRAMTWVDRIEGRPECST